MLSHRAAFPGHELPYTLLLSPGNSHRIDRNRRRRHIAAESALHAYVVRPVPERADLPPTSAPQLVGSYLVVTFNPASAALPDREPDALRSQLRRALTKAPALYRVTLIL